MNKNALEPCKESEVVLTIAFVRGPVACSRCGVRDAEGGNEPTLLKRRGNLNVKEKGHSDGIVRQPNVFEMNAL